MVKLFYWCLALAYLGHSHRIVFPPTIRSAPSTISYKHVGVPDYFYSTCRILVAKLLGVLVQLLAVLEYIARAFG